MRVVHEGAVLADEVEVADSFTAKLRGLRFRGGLPEDNALVFPFDGPGYRDVDMLFVGVPIDAVWLVDGAVTKRKRLRPWLGVGIGRADTLVELPAGAAAGVDVGDRMRVEGLE